MISEKLFKTHGKRQVSCSREYFIQLDDIQELGNVNVYVVKTTDVVIKEKKKSVVQKSLCWSSESIPQDVFCAKGNGVVLTRRIAKEEVSCRLYANLKNILKTH